MAAVLLEPSPELSLGGGDEGRGVGEGSREPQAGREVMGLRVSSDSRMSVGLEVYV